MNEKDHTERRYTEKEVSETVEKVISEMLARGEIADTRANNGSSAANVEVPTDALINLVNYQEQCDEDGVMVKVSRQALAEVLVYVQMVRLDLNRNEPQVAAVREALELAEDVLSRAPFSTAIWPTILNATRTSVDEVQRLRSALESIADWRNINISGEYEHGLRDIIRSIIDSAVAVLDEPKAPRSPSKPIPKPLHLIDDAGSGP